MTGKAQGKKRAVGRNSFRVIGGTWRGRRLRFADRPGIRPTPDRARETLFNWLQARVAGARCIDLFAGSGALGIEALSRGASEVVFVERDPTAARMIEAHIEALGANGQVRCGDAFDFLRGSNDTFDIAFLDPPFDEALHEPALKMLLEQQRMTANGLVYMEAASGQLADALQPGWEFLRTSRAGQVEYGIATVPKTNVKPE